jgi:hypothetical protein
VCLPPIPKDGVEMENIKQMHSHILQSAMGSQIRDEILVDMRTLFGSSLRVYIFHTIPMYDLKRDICHKKDRVLVPYGECYLYQSVLHHEIPPYSPSVCTRQTSTLRGGIPDSDPWSRRNVILRQESNIATTPIIFWALLIF